MLGRHHVAALSGPAALQTPNVPVKGAVSMRNPRSLHCYTITSGIKTLSRKQEVCTVAIEVLGLSLLNRAMILEVMVFPWL